MKCRQFQQELEQTIDERSSAWRDSLTDHANSCGTCRSAWQDFLLLESALSSWADPMDVDLVDRVIAAVLPSAASPLSGQWNRANAMPRVDKADTHRKSSAVPHARVTTSHFGAWLAVSTVAIVLIGVAIMVQTNPDQIVEQVSPPDPSREPGNPVLQASENRFSGMDDLLADTRSAWEGIARKTVSQGIGLSVFVPDLNSQFHTLVIQDSPGSKTPSAEEDSGEPVIIPDSINRAFDFLLDMSADTATT